jgi:hypothetical protein
LLKWIICDDRPFVSVESEHIRQIFHLLMPRVSTPSADTIKSNAIASFIMERKKIQTLLQVNTI